MTLPLNNPDWRTYLPLRVERFIVEFIAGNDGGPFWTVPLRTRIFMNLCTITGLLIIASPGFVGQTLSVMLMSPSLALWSLGYLGAYVVYASFANAAEFSEVNIFQPLGFHILKRFLAIGKY